MGRELTEQELHNLAMNIVGRELEADGFEFMAINSKLKKNPQYVCLKEKVLHFIVVRNVEFPLNPREYDEELMRTVKDHAEKFEARTYFAGVGLSNASDRTEPLFLDEEYVVDYQGLIEIQMRRILLLLGLVVLLFGCTQKKGQVKNQAWGNALGTTYSIIYIADKELDYQQEIDSVFQVLNQSMSTYIPSSDISKINEGDSTVVVDDMFKEVFDVSSDVHKASNGYFDPTIGVLANAWGFGPGNQMELDSLRVDSLLGYVGWEKVKFNSDNTISKAHPSIRFDFNAVAKGYAIDRLGAMLDAKGIENYLVEVGGEVLAKGTNLDSGKQWTVGIDDPQVETGRELKQIVSLEDMAMASSGNYRKFRVDPETGEKYVHTINPKTGYTKNSNVLATSVVAKTCAVADAYATTFMAMDLEESKEILANHYELEAYIIYLDENGETKEFFTPGFEALVKK